MMNPSARPMANGNAGHPTKCEFGGQHSGLSTTPSQSLHSVVDVAGMSNFVHRLCAILPILYNFSIYSSGALSAVARLLILVARVLRIRDLATLNCK